MCPEDVVDPLSSDQILAVAIWGGSLCARNNLKVYIAGPDPRSLTALHDHGRGLQHHLVCDIGLSSYGCTSVSAYRARTLSTSGYIALDGCMASLP